MLKTTFVAAGLMFAVPSLAIAQPGQQTRMTVPAASDWQLLGEQSVKGKRDKDTIVVGKYEGKFDQIQISVLDSDLELKEIGRAHV